MALFYFVTNASPSPPPSRLSLPGSDRTSAPSNNSDLWREVWCNFSRTFAPCRPIHETTSPSHPHSNLLRRPPLMASRANEHRWNANPTRCAPLQPKQKSLPCCKGSNKTVKSNNHKNNSHLTLLVSLSKPSRKRLLCCHCCGRV